MSIAPGQTMALGLARVRLAGIAGVLGIVLPVAGLFVLPIWEFPGTSSSASQLITFAVAHQSSFHAVMVLNAAGVALWMIFGAGIWLLLLEGGRQDSFLSACFAFGFIAFTTLLLAGFVSGFLIAYRAPHIPDPRLLYDLTFGLLALSGAPTAIALTSYATATFRNRQLPRFTAWLAALAAVAHVVLLFSLVVPSGFFSLEGQVITVVPGLLFLWIFATGIAILTADDQGLLARGHERQTASAP
jgi:hypothetical protein